MGPAFLYSIVVFRHASEVAANFKVRFWEGHPEGPINPTVFTIWTKGLETAINGGVDNIFQLRATLPEDPDTIAIKKSSVAASHRYEWILVGSNPGNAKFVFIDRAVSQPSP